MPASTSVFSLLALLAAVPPQQPPAPTLLESARRQGGDVGRITLACGPLARLEDVVGKASLIVHGVVISKDSRLSEDGMHVFTDYRVQPFEFLREDGNAAARSSGPLLFTARGGTVAVEGFKLTDSFEHNGRGVALEVGDEVILMTTRDGHHLPLMPTGVFFLRDGAVKANGTVEGFMKDDPVTPIDRFIVRIDELTLNHRERR